MAGFVLLSMDKEKWRLDAMGTIVEVVWVWFLGGGAMGTKLRPRYWALLTMLGVANWP